MNALGHHGAVRVGSQPDRDRSARAQRLRLSALGACVYLVLTGLLAWGAAETEAGDTQNVVAVLATAFFAPFCVLLVRSVRLSRGLRRDEHRHA